MAACRGMSGENGGMAGHVGGDVVKAAEGGGMARLAQKFLIILSLSSASRASALMPLSTASGHLSPGLRRKPAGEERQEEEERRKKKKKKKKEKEKEKEKVLEKEKKQKVAERSASFHSSSENEDEIEGNKLSAQLALKEDFNEAHRLRVIEEIKCHPLTCQKWITLLVNHQTEGS